MLFLLKSRKAGILMSNCFRYFSPGKLKTQVQQNKAGMALPVEEREREVVQETKQRQSEIEDPSPREDTNNAVSLGWIN